MYIADSYENCRAPDFDLEKIEKIIDTRDDGTSPEEILNLNRVSEVASAMPSIEFELQIKYHTLDELIKEREEDQPSIAWIRLTDEGNIHGCTHAIVITDVDKPNNLIYYNDPIFGERTEPIDKFLARWDDEDRVLVKIKIGKKKQRMLEDFGKNQESQENQGV